MTGSWRLFVAAAVPDDTRSALAAWTRERAGRGTGWRPVRRENIHLTLRFLGDAPSEEAEGLVAAFEDALPSVPSSNLVVRGVGVFPHARRPRVLWAGLEGDLERLVALVRRVEEWVVARGFPREDRPFRAHLTLARAGRGKVRVPAAVGAVPDEAPEFGPMVVDRVGLYRSHLSTGPPRYERLADALLSERRAP